MTYMNNNPTFITNLVIFTMIFGALTFARFYRKKRDERECQAFVKALKFTTYTSLSIALFGGFISVINSNFSLPITYIFILIIISFTLLLLMYEVYLLFDSLEAPFISKMDKLGKIKFYKTLSDVISIILFCFMAGTWYNINIRFIDFKTFPQYSLEMYICLYIKFTILILIPRLTPSERLNQQDKQKK